PDEGGAAIAADCRPAHRRDVRRRGDASQRLAQRGLVRRSRQRAVVGVHDDLAAGGRLAVELRLEDVERALRLDARNAEVVVGLAVDRALDAEDPDDDDDPCGDHTERMARAALAEGEQETGHGGPLLCVAPLRAGRGPRWGSPLTDLWRAAPALRSA